MYSAIIAQWHAVLFPGIHGCPAASIHSSVRRDYPPNVEVRYFRWDTIMKVCILKYYVYIVWPGEVSDWF